MQLSGNLRKMRVVHADPVAYFLRMGDEELALNPLVGEQLSLRFSGHIHCIACGREINKSFNQGYCFPCFRSLAQCDRCMVSPELCHFHLGTCREPDWGLAHCMQPHVVYLANTSGIKVGITRATQVPTRWIDQGAVQALPLMNVTSRRASGVVETALKSHMADRTDWRRMLKGPPESADLADRAAALQPLCHAALAAAGENETPLAEPGVEAQHTFEYPVLTYPERVRSINAEKVPHIEGRLLGIKGQYLIFEAGVINLRKYAGYEATVDA
jgi:hypothetical protein